MNTLSRLKRILLVVTDKILFCVFCKAELIIFLIALKYLFKKLMLRMSK